MQQELELTLFSLQFYHETLLPYAAKSVQHTCVPSLLRPLQLLSALFNSRSSCRPLRSWSQLPNPGFPILFNHVGGLDLEIDEGASFFNDAEVAQVRAHILALVRPPVDQAQHGTVAPKEISVISPFREQVWRIRLALRAVGLGEVDVGNVEALQGAEKYVLLSLSARRRSSSSRT